MDVYDLDVCQNNFNNIILNDLYLYIKKSVQRNSRFSHLNFSEYCMVGFMKSFVKLNSFRMIRTVIVCQI